MWNWKDRTLEGHKSLSLYERLQRSPMFSFSISSPPSVMDLVCTGICKDRSLLRSEETSESRESGSECSIRGAIDALTCAERHQSQGGDRNTTKGASGGKSIVRIWSITILMLWVRQWDSLSGHILPRGSVSQRPTSHPIYCSIK